MKSNRQLRLNSWLLLLALTAVAFMSAGCSSSSVKSSPQVNPLSAYQETNYVGGPVTDGNTQTPGAINSPIISIPPDGSSSIDGHENAPLLDNMHPGWQQATCLACHDATTRNPDHNYTDASLCHLCHGTNGLPGFADNIPPVISSVVSSPSDNSVILSWKTDEKCLSRLVLRTVVGDRLEFPVSTSYSTNHRYEVKGLIPETSYYFELVNTDRNGNRTSSSSFGTLGFTTLSAQIDPGTITSPEDEPEVDSFFSNVSIEANGAFKADVKFVAAEPSTVFIYFVYADTDQLATQMKLNSLVNNQPITTFDGFVTGLDADTEYKVYLEAEDSLGKVRKSRIINMTTEPFE
jgi:hypothetical protein